MLRSPRFVHGGRNRDCRGRRGHSVNVALAGTLAQVYTIKKVEAQLQRLLMLHVTKALICAFDVRMQKRQIFS